MSSDQPADPAPSRIFRAIKFRLDRVAKTRHAKLRARLLAEADVLIGVADRELASLKFLYIQLSDPVRAKSIASTELGRREATTR